jgi:hypothetical protein
VRSGTWLEDVPTTRNVARQVTPVIAVIFEVEPARARHRATSSSLRH